MNKKIKYSLWFLGFLLAAMAVLMLKNHFFNPHSAVVYTCPMPQDSVFSNQAGNCPKCGMKLILVKNKSKSDKAQLYTCSMHPEIEQDSPGNCPICGMTLVQKIKATTKVESLDTDQLLQNTNEFFAGNYKTIHPKDTVLKTKINTPGLVVFDPNANLNIAARVGGRIEKMYVNYSFQKIRKGQKLFEIYSPELATAQQNFIYLLTNDSENSSLLKASKQKLALYGMTDLQINALATTQKSNPVVPVYSPATGLAQATEGMNSGMNAPTTSTPLSIKEGDYVQKNQTVFKLVSTAKVWAVFNIAQGQSSLVKRNQRILIKTEWNEAAFFAQVNFIETQVNPSEKTNKIRVYLDNKNRQLPIGLRLEGQIEVLSPKNLWLPKQALIAVGTQKVAFVKTPKGYQAKALNTGIEMDHFIQIIDGISKKDAVIENAQYLIDSESFIKIKK